MPVQKKKSAIPKAALSKRLRHAFYLVQPVIQFVALLSLMLVLSHCSPLSPSTPKTIAPRGGNEGGGAGGNANNEEFLRENLIVTSLKELPSDTLSVVSEEGFQAASENSFQADQPVRETEVKTRIARRNRLQVTDVSKKARRPLLTVSLTADQQQALWREGSVRVPLANHLQASFELNALKLLFRELQQKRDHLHASAYLVVSDNGAPLNGADPHELVMKLKISLGVVSDEKAYLEVRRNEDDSKTALLLSAARGVRKLAVVLE